MIQSNSKTIVERISRYLDFAFPIFFFLLPVSFYLRTYDSAMVKITEVQMFGTILMGLWICKIFERGHWPFTKTQTLLVLPFVAIFCSGVLSFLLSPLPLGSLDFFIRRVVYIGLALIAISEMTSLEDCRRMVWWLRLALIVTTVYGLIQWVDFQFFPPGPPVMGLDKFVWRAAFGQRIFSTFGNPNFYSNFLVIMVPLMMALYLKDRQFYILPLIVLTLANIYWTGSKGPAMGLIGGTAVFSFLVIRFFVESRKVRIAVFASAGFVILALGGYVVKRVFYRGDVTSFTFRMYTWLSTWEMINAKPILGNGIGTYWVLYPAYRRPSIFHIEGKHNTETDHSENEHLEVWMDEGIVGMGLWIWMIAMISIGVYRALSMLTTQPARAGPGKSEKKFPEEAYYMLGTVSGFLGMLIHNITDVSMRFVSSGAPFWLLAGFNAALVLYCPMPEKQISGAGEFKPADETSNPTRKWIKPILRVVTVTVVILVAIRILRQFDWCQGRDGMKNPNESPHFFTTWTFFLLCWGSSVWWFLRIALQSTRIKTLLTVLTATILLIPFWGHFVGDVNHNRAIFFSKQGMWVRSSESDGKVGGFPPEYQIMYRGSGGGTTELDSSFGKVLTAIFPDMIWRKNGIGAALEHYDEVNRLRPDFIMAFYFRGNVYNDWGSQFAQKTHEAFTRGDVAQAEIFRKKSDELWSKAMGAYDETRNLSPNYVQVLHQVGLIHHKWGDFFNSLAPLAEQYGRKELADEYRKQSKEHLQEALRFFRLYYKIDPVYDQNFYRQAQVYIQLGELDNAEQVYLDHLQAKECKKPYHQIFNGFYVKSHGSKYHRYDLASKEHTHDIVINSKPESWSILGDFYTFIKKSPLKAEIAYKRAVELRPDNVDFVKRLASFYGGAGRLADSLVYWRKAHQLNPNDPDVQRVSQSPMFKQ